MFRCFTSHFCWILFHHVLTEANANELMQKPIDDLKDDTINLQKDLFCLFVLKTAFSQKEKKASPYKDESVLQAQCSRLNLRGRGPLSEGDPG